MRYECSVSISNKSNRPLTFHLEPWGQQFSMPVGSTFQVKAEATEQGEMEIQYEEHAILVWGWTGSILTVFLNGKDLADTPYSKRGIVPPVSSE